MLFLFFKSDDFTGTYVLLSESVDKSLAKYARGVKKKLIKNRFFEVVLSGHRKRFQVD